jgi:hypothetical protein
MSEYIQISLGPILYQRQTCNYPKKCTTSSINSFLTACRSKTDEPLFNRYFYVKYDANGHFLEFVFNNPALCTPIMFLLLFLEYAAVMAVLCQPPSHLKHPPGLCNVFVHLQLYKKHQNGVILYIFWVVPFHNDHFTELSHLM